MATVWLQKVVEDYHDIMENQTDPRVNGWPLMQSFLPTAIACTAYIYFAKVLGPRLMKDRKPFELRNVLIAYNAFQVIVSAWLVYHGLYYWFFRYNLYCEPVDYSPTEDATWVAKLCWVYYFLKFTEFLDTVFFVMRKKFDQVTNLHVIHHAVMPATCWWGIKFAAGGHATFFGTVNTFIHVVMYFYYLMAAMGPQYQKYLWWKKYLTLMQMIQFVAVFLHSAQVLFNGCQYPKLLAIVQTSHALMFLGLFSNFYIQAYIRGRRTPKIKAGHDINKNGYSNGVNSYTNGYTNGHCSNGIQTNDQAKSNGVKKTD